MRTAAHPVTGLSSRREFLRNCAAAVVAATLHSPLLAAPAPEPAAAELVVATYNLSYAGDQPDYDWIGLGRDGGSRGEFMAVFARRDGQRIDWILARGVRDVRPTEAVTLRPDGRWPSDHLPVVAWLTLQ